MKERNVEESEFQGPQNSALALGRTIVIYSIFYSWLLFCAIGIIFIPILIGFLLYQLFEESAASKIWLLGIPVAVITGVTIIYRTIRDRRRMDSELTINRSEIKWLDAALTELENKFGRRIRRFTRIEITPATELSTYQHGTHRVLTIGIITLLMPDILLRAALAHEYAHHLAGAMHYHRSIWYVRRAASRWVEAIRSANRSLSHQADNSYISHPYQAASVLMLPGALIGFFSIWLLVWVLSRIYRTRSHEYEYYCDKEAARYCSPIEFGDALLNVVSLSENFVYFCTRHPLNSDFLLEDFVSHTENFRTAFTLQSEESDSHPALNDRLTRIGSSRSLHAIMPQLAADAMSRVANLTKVQPLIRALFCTAARARKSAYHSQTLIGRLAHALDLSDEGYSDLVAIVSISKQLPRSGLEENMHEIIRDCNDKNKARERFISILAPLMIPPSEGNMIGKLNQASEAMKLKFAAQHALKSDQAFLKFIGEAAAKLTCLMN